MTSYWARWRHKSPASRLLIQSADKRKHQSSASLAFVRGIHRWPVNSPLKGPITRKMFSLDDVIMVSGSVIGASPHCGLVMPYGNTDQGCSGNGLLADGTKPLPKPMSIYRRCGSPTFTPCQIPRKCSWYQFIKYLWEKHKWSCFRTNELTRLMAGVFPLMVANRGCRLP